MHNLTVSQQLILWVGVMAALSWMWFCYMVGRIVRWTYLEKKQARRDADEAAWVAGRAASRVPARWGR